MPNFTAPKTHSLLFDMRPVAGDFSLYQTLAAANREGLKDAGMFKSVLACVSSTRKPPLGFFRNFVLERSGEHKDQLDLKLFATAPIVDAARVFALDAGIEHTNTPDRLSALATAPVKDQLARNAALDSLRYVVLDTELTSLDHRTNRMLSIGAIAMLGPSIQLGTQFYRVVNPHVPIPAETVVIHNFAQKIWYPATSPRSV
ncbi:MAG TPA: putative nucleotidyltransferase substrate binding domain-containing protein [Candidatus Sulfotelmatobacter sp.]